MIEGMLHDGLKYDSNVVDLLAQEDINPAKFAERAMKFSRVERLAIIDMTQRYWGQSNVQC